MTKQGRHLYEFGRFQVDPVERLLLREGRPIHLTPKAFETLLMLVRSSGHLIEKSELLSTVWAHSFVEEGNLAVTISTLRKALGDDGKEHKCIETVTRLGYRFVVDVREVVEPEPELLAPCAGLHSLAVLPFRSMNSEAAHEYLRLGLTDAIIRKLASIGQIIVRPTSAMLKYADPLADPLAVGREQMVDAILVGRIEAFPDRVLLTVQLISVGDGSLRYSNTFEQGSREILALEDEVVRGVAQSISNRPAGKNARLAWRDSVNSKAYQLYLEGRYFWSKRTEEGLRRSIEYFQQATAEDAQYALAYAGLADAYVLLDSFGVEPASYAYPAAKAAALKALQFDNSLAESHASLGMVYFYYEWKWSEAEQEFQRAIALNPNYVLAHSWYALNLGAMGRYEEAFDHVRQAQQLDPLSLEINTVVGRIFYFSRQYDRSVNAYRKAIDLDPYYARAHTRLGMTYAAMGAFGDAIHEFEESQRLSGADPNLDGLLGYAQALSGNTGKARKLLKELTQRPRRDYVPAFSMALIWIGFGQRDHALECLARSYQDRSTDMVYSKTEPLLDPVRSDPRFTALLQQMGLSKKRSNFALEVSPAPGSPQGSAHTNGPVRRSGA
jgi:DNA-binding winged helix-turn-helix (wHTH) protein/tetratricopeptide (TPR) repeat protein